MEKAHYERINPSPAQSWTHFRRRGIFEFSWHFHPEYELTLIEGGTGTRFVGDNVAGYRPGDLVLLGPNLPHTFASDTAGLASCSQFLPDLLGVGGEVRPEFTQVAGLLERADRGLLARVDLEDWPRLDRLDPARRSLRLIEMLVDLSERDDLEPLAGEGYVPVVDSAVVSRIEAIVGYIAKHLSEPIALDDLARVAAMSRATTSRFFRRQTGVTITEYVNRARISQACRALRDPAQPIAAIAYGCGYGNLSHFNREFKRRVGKTPRQFRESQFKELQT